MVEKIINKCEIYLGKDLISGEEILKKYLEFFAEQFGKEEKKLSFSLHTGSLCFDIIAIIAVALGCLTYNMTSNEKILDTFSIGDIVVFKNSRYRWLGISDRDGKKYIVLEQDNKGKKFVPYDVNKYLVRPYYGGSKITDSRGIRKKNHDREGFLSWLLNVPVQEIPSELDIAVVIISDRKQFTEIVKNVKLLYNGGMEIGLLDIMPASYYTSNDEEQIIGKNPTKAEAVLKVTAKISEARSLVLKKHGNRVIGLLVTGVDSSVKDNSELTDLLRRKNLKFVHVMGALRLVTGEDILEIYEEADVFACTKQYLKEHNNSIYHKNELTSELNMQICNIIKSEIFSLKVDEGGWSWEQYSYLKKSIYQVEQSNWDAKNDFALSSLALLNLFNTAVFDLNDLEMALIEKKINIMVVSPKYRIEQLRKISCFAGDLREICVEIIDKLEEKYEELLNNNGKKNALEKYVRDNFRKKIMIILPKAYYVDFLKIKYGKSYLWDNVMCTTFNRYNSMKNYDNILIVGNLTNRKFDLLKCKASDRIDVLLYSCEEKIFNQTKKKTMNLMRKLNKKQGIQQVEQDNSVEEEDDVLAEKEVQEFLDVEQYLDSMNLYNFRKFLTMEVGSGTGSVNAEVNVIGTFITGEQIFFSKNYSPIVYNPELGKVIETKPERLVAGDILIFMKRNNYTQNVVDFVYDQLIERKKFNSTDLKATDMAKYWKDVLRKYKEGGDYTYQDIAIQMKEYGSTLQTVTIRQWLMEDSHVVGPRDEQTMQQIAFLTKDEKLLANIHEYFEACRIVRHKRKEILGLIGKAITDKLAGNHPQIGSILSIVYDNVENLSETIELESIANLDATVNIPISLVNRPITEMEALL